MNKRQRAILLKAADRIEAEPDSYNQDDWFDWRYDSEYSADAEAQLCNTTACVAGHILLAQPRKYKLGSGTWGGLALKCGSESVDDYADRAGEAVGFSLEESDYLFDSRWRPTGWRVNWTHGTTARAVAEDLRAIADGASVQDRGGWI